MIPIVRIPGDFILTDYRDPLWTLIEDTVDNVKDIILMIYCDGQKDMVTIANYINDLNPNHNLYLNKHFRCNYI